MSKKTRKHSIGQRHLFYLPEIKIFEGNRDEDVEREKLRSDFDEALTGVLVGCYLSRGGQVVRVRIEVLSGEGW